MRVPRLRLAHSSRIADLHDAHRTPLHARVVILEHISDLDRHRLLLLRVRAHSGVVLSEHCIVDPLALRALLATAPPLPDR